MKQHQYIHSVVRRLKCSARRKADIRQELEADIRAAQEQGESWEQIEQRMGSPAAAAAEFNESFSPEEQRAARRSRILKTVAGLIVILAAAVLLLSFLIPRSYPLGTHTGFNQQAVSSATHEVIALLDAEDYESLRAMSATQMHDVLSPETMQKVKDQIGTDWGSLEAFGTEYMADVKQLGKWYATVQTVAVYENATITYTISFDESMQLAGLYLK